MSSNQIYNSSSQQVFPNNQSGRNGNVQAHVVHQQIKIVPSGISVKLDCNPIAKYNHTIKNYNQYCNQIEGIQLSQVWCPWLVSWVYDFIIYFYTMFFMSITCQNQNDKGWLITLILLVIYVIILIMPIISVITFIISALFFIYYIAGYIMHIVNSNRLGNHLFTEKMVHSSKAPPLQGFMNQFFQITSQQTIRYYQSNNMWDYYQTIVSKYKGEFMAYTNQFLQDYYNYIKSCKMISFHIAFMIVAIIGLIISVNAFPSAYGK